MNRSKQCIIAFIMLVTFGILVILFGFHPVMPKKSSRPICNVDELKKKAQFTEIKP